jgi:hypothetical protein
MTNGCLIVFNDDDESIEIIKMIKLYGILLHN